jgi:hypothetical protein
MCSSGSEDLDVLQKFAASNRGIDVHAIREMILHPIWLPEALLSRRLAHRHRWDTVHSLQWRVLLKGGFKRT